MQAPTLEEIVQARDTCAQAIALYGERYLPIFERLENEVATRQKQEALLRKAMGIAEKKDAGNPMKQQEMAFCLKEKFSLANTQCT